DASEDEPDREKIADLLRRSQVHTENLGEAFLPPKVLEEILTEERIRMEIEAYRDQQPDSWCGQGLNDCANLIRCRYLKIFAILILLDKGEDIGKFIEEGVSDEDLPLVETQVRHMSDLVRSKSPNNPLGCFDTWMIHEREQFSRYQYRVNLPFLSFDTETNSVRHVDFTPQTILPFSECGGSIEGIYSRISKIKIHRDCHGFSNILKKIQTNDVFAVKRLRINHGDNVENCFHREVNMLKNLSRTHNHLLSLLMTWSYRNDHYLLFPLADCNLADYWNKESQTPSRSETKGIDLGTARWVSEQILGLMDALDSLHHPRGLSSTKFGRHGDLKPENILWYNDPEGGRGTLVISDFGCSTLNTQYSRSNITAARVPLTPAYRPPECDLEGGKISRASDIWSFGCVLLEFVCWALGGGELVQTFAKRRISPYITGLSSDSFFDVNAKADDGGYVITVKDVVSMTIAELHKNAHCTQYFHNLLDIIEREMIVILSSESLRSDSTVLLRKFNFMHSNTTDDPDYCQTPCPESRPTES
ncbi:kinase-like protein, partial [Lindgomyces ingoldianus]